MSNLLIGDIHGCYDTFMRLLEKANVSSSDTLWLSGDLIARGPKSLEVLRFVSQNAANIRLVLGNHDLHLIALHAQIAQKKGHKDNLQPLLEAPDCDELIFWLRQQPFVQYDPHLKIILTHAGYYPWWDLPTLLRCADELHQIVASDAYSIFIHEMYGDYPSQWQDDLTQFDRFRFIANALTRMRYCTLNGHLDLNAKGHPKHNDNPYLKPWFQFPLQIPQEYMLFFGHWAALNGTSTPENIIALDTGCCWGNKLTAYRFEDHTFFRKKNKTLVS